MLACVPLLIRHSSVRTPLAPLRSQEMAGDPFALLLKQRIIFLGGEVSDFSADAIVSQLLLLDAQDHTKASAWVHVDVVVLMRPAFNTTRSLERLPPLIKLKNSHLRLLRRTSSCSSIRPAAR